VQEVDLTKPFKEEIKASCSRNLSAELSDKHSDNITKHEEIVMKSKLEENFTESCIELPPIPKTACQFIINWRKYTSSDFRYKYIKVSNNLLFHIKNMKYIQKVKKIIVLTANR
jgi:hypothetical protein